MTSILLAAGLEDESLHKKMVEALEPHFSVLHSFRRKLIAQGDRTEFLVGNINHFDSITCEHAILVYKEKMPCSPQLHAKQPIVAVVDSSNRELLSFVAGTELPAITCGLSSLDTITLSSMDTDSAVITLQRSISCLDGTEAEPQEFPVKITGAFDSFAIMAIAAVFILCGQAQKLENSML